MDNTASHTCTRFEATYLNLQRIVTDPIQSFRCLACKSPQLLPSLPSLLLHFTTEHGVNLLSTASTQASPVMLTPAGLMSSLQAASSMEHLAFKRMKEHLESRHGLFFQKDWKLFQLTLQVGGRRSCVHWWDDFSGLMPHGVWVGNWNTDDQSVNLSCIWMNLSFIRNVECSICL